MMEERIRAVVGVHGHLMIPIEELSDRCDLYDAGLTSHASVNLMLGLEKEFKTTFPDRLLCRGTFESVSAIRDAITESLA
jgi:acyl carrier protein